MRLDSIGLISIFALALAGGTACDRSPGAEPGDPGGADDDPSGGDSAESDDVPGEPLTICDAEAADPQVDASVVIDLSQWPEATGTHQEGFTELSRVDAQCRVESVGSNESSVTTRLVCEPQDLSSRIMDFTLGAADGPVAWAPGDDVVVFHERLAYSVPYGVEREELSVRRRDGTLLVATRNQQPDYPETFAPVALTIDDEFCEGQPTEELDDDGFYLRLQFDNGAGESLALGRQQRGVLPAADDDGVFAIDVGDARGGMCCHWSREVEVVLRRIE